MFKFKLLRPYQIISKMNELCLKIDLTILVILEVRSEILSANYSFLCLIYNCSLLESRSPILGKLAYLLKKKKNVCFTKFWKFSKIDLRLTKYASQFGKCDEGLLSLTTLIFPIIIHCIFDYILS